MKKKRQAHLITKYAKFLRKLFIHEPVFSHYMVIKSYTSLKRPTCGGSWIQCCSTCWICWTYTEGPNAGGPNGGGPNGGGPKCGGPNIGGVIVEVHMVLLAHVPNKQLLS